MTDARNAFKHNRHLNPSELASAEAGLLWIEDCLLAIDTSSGEDDDEEEPTEEEALTGD